MPVGPRDGKADVSIRLVGQSDVLDIQSILLYRYTHFWRCRLEQCEATQVNAGGGAIQAVSLELLEISQCLLSRNKALSNGGAIDTSGVKQVHFIDSNFTQNSVTGLVGELGGPRGGAAVLMTSEVVVIAGCFIANNTAHSGGGIKTNNCVSVNVHDSTFRFNKAWDQGGGLLTTNTQTTSTQMVKLLRCNFWGNAAGIGGGSFHFGDGSRNAVNLTVSKCTYSANVATFNCGGAHPGGGGILSQNVLEQEISDSCFVNNSAKDSNGGGAVFMGSTEQNTADAAKWKFLMLRCEFTQNHARVREPGSDDWCTKHPEACLCPQFGEYGRGSGGGAFLQALPNAQVQDCSFTSNSAKNGGGVFLMKMPDVQLQDGTFMSNAAESDGGGVCLSNTHNAQFSRCSFMSKMPGTATKH